MQKYEEINDSQREKRRELKQRYEELQLPNKVILNNFVFSLDNILQEKVVFICSRRVSMDCDVRIHITWEQLEKAPNRLTTLPNEALDINGVLFYNIKGEHSEACRLRNAFNSNLTTQSNTHLWVEKVDSRKTLDTELDDLFKDSAHFTVSCLLYTSPSPRDLSTSRMPSSA